jgi:hypothetical protein
MSFGAPKSEYKAAIEELRAPLVKLEQQLCDCIAPLECVKRFRFRSQAKEKEMAAYIREGAAKLAPLIAKCNFDGLTEWCRQTEAAATAVSKEE